MKRKGKESKLNVVLSSLLVVFICLLCFAIGVISGKGWSDREYKVRHIESDHHMKAAQEDTELIGDEMTEKEVEMLTQRALEEAKAQSPAEQQAQNKEEPEVKIKDMTDTSSDMMAAQDSKPKERDEKPMMDPEEGADKTPLGREASTARMNKDKMMSDKMATKRKVSSIRTQPTTPKPETIEYTVQVAAYKTLQEAEDHSQKLIDKGFPAFPVKAYINGQLWYRVSIGSFKNRKSAMKYERALKKQSVVKSTFVQRITRLEK